MRQIATVFFLTISTIPIFAQTPQARPFVLGVMETIKSVQLGEERMLNISLLEGFGVG